MNKIIYFSFFIFLFSCNSKKEIVWENFKVLESFGIKNDFTTKPKGDLVCPRGFRHKSFKDELTPKEAELLDNVIQPIKIFIFECVNELNEKEQIVLTYKPSNNLNQVMYHKYPTEEGECSANKDLLLKHLDSVRKFEEFKDEFGAGWEAYGSFEDFDSKVSCSRASLLITLWRKGTF